MVFGIGKKQEKAVPEGETLKQDNDLAVSYGNGEEVKDDVSTTDSIPPPPPIGDEADFKDVDLSKEDSQTLEELPSVEANDDPEGLVDVKKEAELIKRKKMLLIASCVVSFFIFLGLAIKYGQVRNQSNANASLTAGLDNGVSDSPIEDIDIEPGTSSPTTLNVPPTSNTVVDTDTDPQTEVLITGGGQGTLAPSIDGTSIGSRNFPVINPFEGCALNEITVLTTCVNNIGAAVSMNFCMVDELSDQFWAWVSTPPRTAPIVANNWGWMMDGAEVQLPFLAEGSYEIGVFSNGEEQLDEYPLVFSTEFTVDCRP